MTCIVTIYILNTHNMLQMPSIIRGQLPRNYLEQSPDHRTGTGT